MRSGFCAVLIVLSTLAIGQEPSISGRITDASTGDPLPGTTILVAQGKGTVSDSQGDYYLKLSAGTVNLQYQFVGYKTLRKSFSLKVGDSLVVDLSLEPDITQIGQIVVSASRIEQRIAETTVSMSIIKPQDYQLAQINDPKELMNKTSGIEVLDGQASVRGGSGFSYGAGSRVLTLVDGLPVLGADAGSIRWQFLPLENLSQIEIIKGASSVLYGSSALNGVINFRTAQATETGSTTFFLESGIYDTPANQNWKWWDGHRHFHSGSFAHLKRYGNTEVAIGTFLMKNDGYRRLNNENLARFNVNIRHHHLSIPGLSYGLNTNMGYVDKRDFVLWEDATEGALRQAESTAINLRGTFLTLDPFVRFRQSARTTHDLRMRLQHTSNNYPDAERNNSDATSFYAEYQNRYTVSQYVDLNAGLVQYASMIRSLFYGDHNALNLATYLQADVSPLERLKLVSGVRFEHNSLNGNGDRVVGLLRAGLNYQAHEFTFLRASFGQGYRYPSIAEKHAATTLGAVRIFPNSFLEAESGWNSELAMRQGVALEQWSGMFDFALFYAQNKDLIEYMFGLYPDPETGNFEFGFRAVNTEYSRLYGAEIEFVLHRKSGEFDYTLAGGYVYMYPVAFDPRTAKNTGVFLKYRRNHSAKASLAAQYKAFRASTDLYLKSKILNIDDVFVDELTREVILPGFFDYWQQNNTGHFVMDVNLGWTINQTYAVSLALKNITNTEYMGRPGDIQPPRSFSLRFQGSL